MTRLALTVGLVALAGCEPEPVLPDCVDLGFEIDSCAPLYQPIFDNIYISSIDGQCDTQGGSCHFSDTARGATNGVVFKDIDSAFDGLMGESDGHPLVDVEDPSCSVLMVRLAVDEEQFRMPPGESALPENELCAIAQWMADGAER